MGSGWVIIFVFFNEFVDDPIGHSSINQETPVVYQSLKDCNENVMDAARKRNWQKFGVAHYGTTGEDEQRIEITTLDQSSSSLILHHKITCMEVKGFE